jgi:hypothetical protein
MIDWNTKLIELKAMVDEMEMWAGKTEGHLRSMLGRNADELRLFVHQIEAELVPTERGALEPPPDWVIDPGATSNGDEGYSSADDAGPGDYSDTGA